MSEHVSVGRVGRPHGREGAVVLEDASEDAARFAPGATVYARGEPVRVVAAKRAGGRLVVTFERELARGTELTVPLRDLPAPEEGSYYAFQLVGLAVEEEAGRPLGRVREVAPGVANDVLELDSGLALPLVEDCVRAVDLDGGRIVVAPGFADWG